ncbi:MAG: thrombospondin type 3 repeat-containing protein [Micrococcales bacterium]
MPKRSKPRRAARAAQTVSDTATLASTRRRKVTRSASIIVVLALVATILVGALASSPAKAATNPATASALWGGAVSSTQEPGGTPEPDTDGDGIPNNADPDIDGDGIVNGVDPDIDGDGIPNATDGDPANTNGTDSNPVKQTVNAPLPRLIPKEFDTPAGRAVIALFILGAGTVTIWVRRKRHK